VRANVAGIHKVLSLDSQDFPHIVPEPADVGKIFDDADHPIGVGPTMLHVVGPQLPLDILQVLMLFQRLWRLGQQKMEERYHSTSSGVLVEGPKVSDTSYDGAPKGQPPCMGLQEVVIVKKRIFLIWPKTNNRQENAAEYSANNEYSAVNIAKVSICVRKKIIFFGVAVANCS
jgi:hypothetical protein